MNKIFRPDIIIIYYKEHFNRKDNCYSMTFSILVVTVIKKRYKREKYKTRNTQLLIEKERRKGLLRTK